MEKKIMDLICAKTILYAYPNLIGLSEQIDELMQKKAIASMTDFSPAIEQCEKIIELTEQKKIYLKIYLVVSKVLQKFDDEDIKCVEYKYFKNRPKDYFIDFDFSSRAYFRRQNKIIRKFSELLEKTAICQDFFDNKCLSINFFRELKKRVIEQETLSIKNKPKQKLLESAFAIDKKAKKLA